MEDSLSGFFNDFDRGSVSRRQLLQMLGAAAVSAPMAAFGQGRCYGDNTGRPECNTKTYPAPFAPTGWKTVLLDHLSFQVSELEKEASYYSALMGWKVRSNDGKTVVMDIGNWGGVIMHGGLPLNPPTQGRRERGGAAHCIVDGFCFGIEPWDIRKVEAELKARGLNPVADHNPKQDFFSFHVKDPDGFDLQVSNGNRKNRRTTPPIGELNLPPLFAATGWQTLFLDHISFNATNYKETVAFYEALMGWKGLGDEGSQNETIVSYDIGGLLIRGTNPMTPGYQAPNPRRARIDHLAFGIADFDPDKVKAELRKRGLDAETDTGATSVSAPFERDIHTSSYKSYHTNTPNGYDLQISNHIKGNMPVTATGR